MNKTSTFFCAGREIPCIAANGDDIADIAGIGVRFMHFKRMIFLRRANLIWFINKDHRILHFHTSRHGHHHHYWLLYRFFTRCVHQQC